MARILVCADGYFRYFSPVALEPYIESFINVLARHGNIVMPYIAKDFESSKSWKRKLISHKAVSEVKKFDPEIVFAFNNSFDTSFFKSFNCPVFIVASDSPIYWKNKDYLKRYSDLYSVLYFNDDMRDVLLNEYKIPFNRQYVIPYSTDIKSNSLIEQDKQISFIGNFYNPSTWMFNYLFSNLKSMSDDNKLKLRHLFISFIDELNLHHSKTQKALEIYKQIISLLGRDLDYEQCISRAFEMLTSEKRIELLSSLKDLDLNIYTWDQNLNCVANFYTLFKKCFYNAIYTTQANQEIYNSSIISLSMPHAQVNTGFSWRVCDIMASNSLLIANPTDDLFKLFRGIIPTYKTSNELRDKCLYYLNNELERKEIVNTCNRLIDKNHRYENVFAIVENITGIKLLYVSDPTTIKEFSRVERRKQNYLKDSNNG